MRLLKPDCNLHAHTLRFDRWNDAVPYPEWELVTDDEPEARDGSSAGNGVAAELVDTGTTRGQPAAELNSAGSGDAEQVRCLAVTAGFLWCLT